MNNKTFSERIMIINGKVQRDEQENKKKQLDKENKVEKLRNDIYELKERINDLIMLANYCIEKGVKIPEEGSFGVKAGKKYGYSHEFFAEGFNHHTGFMGRGKVPIKYLGIYNGGFCGVYDFYTNGDETFSEHEKTKEITEARIQDMKQFLEEFEQFENAFYKWIDSLEE